jgi:hypothetical protein
MAFLVYCQKMQQGLLRSKCPRRLSKAELFFKDKAKKVILAFEGGKQEGGLLGTDRIEGWTEGDNHIGFVRAINNPAAEREPPVPPPRKRVPGYVVLIRYRTQVSSLYDCGKLRGMKPSPRIKAVNEYCKRDIVIVIGCTPDKEFTALDGHPFPAVVPVGERRQCSGLSPT